MKDETAVVTIEEFVEWNPKMYSYLVNDIRDDKKPKVSIEMLLQRSVITNIRCFVEQEMFETFNE